MSGTSSVVPPRGACFLAGCKVLALCPKCIRRSLCTFLRHPASAEILSSATARIPRCAKGALRAGSPPKRTAPTSSCLAAPSGGRAGTSTSPTNRRTGSGTPSRCRFRGGSSAMLALTFPSRPSSSSIGTTRSAPPRSASRASGSRVRGRWQTPHSRRGWASSPRRWWPCSSGPGRWPATSSSSRTPATAGSSPPRGPGCPRSRTCWARWRSSPRGRGGSRTASLALLVGRQRSLKG
mmetsp:Transcript_93565/g.302837  ORF Transcript_93565/g.302837 Transcript_93565/m.302837 type:complete len:237 (+) Transcript_93565:279-989(+)